MIVRNCAGGIVFHGDTVFLLQNDKRDWAFPKGVIRDNRKLTDVAVERLMVEAGIQAKVLAPCGKTHYEFYSVTRQKPVHNNVSWFVMEAMSTDITLDESEGFIDGRFFSMEEALDTITYSQDRSLLLMAYQKYRELNAI